MAVLVLTYQSCFACACPLVSSYALRRYRARLTLHTLMLYGCRFGDAGLAALCSALVHAPPRRSNGQTGAADAATSPLRCLGFGGNGFTAEGMATLARALRPIASSGSEGSGGGGSSSSSSSSTGQAAPAVAAPTVPGQLSGLRKLFVEEQPGVGAAGLKALLPALAAGCPALTHLQLTRLGAGDGAVAALLLPGVRLPALRVLGLRHNGFTDSGGAALIHALHGGGDGSGGCGGAARGLEVLWLGGNVRLADRTAEALAGALRVATLPSAARLLPPSPSKAGTKLGTQTQHLLSASGQAARTPQQSDDDETAAAAAAAAAATVVAEPCASPPENTVGYNVSVGQAMSLSWRHAVAKEEADALAAALPPAAATQTTSVLALLSPPVAVAAALPLREVELSGTAVGDEGAGAIAAALTGRPAPRKRRGGGTGSGACAELGVAGLPESMTAALAGCTLQRLAMAACAELTAEGVAALVAAQSVLQRAALEGSSSAGGAMEVLVLDKIVQPKPLEADEAALLAGETGKWQPPWLAKHAANSVR